MTLETGDELTTGLNSADGGWTPAPNVRLSVDNMCMNYLAEPDLRPLSSWIAKGDFGRGARPNFHIYSDILLDLTRLIEEFRFEMAVGAMYAEGLEPELTELNNSETTGFAAYGMPASVKALLSGYSARTPSPYDLLTSPASRISGSRLLGGWWAAQLLDSALIRGRSAMDRLAALLFCADDAQLDPNHLPAMAPETIKKLKSWAGTAEIAELQTTLADETYEFVRSMRDGLVHRKRKPMVLHGDHVLVAPDEGGDPAQNVAGISPDIQIALGLAFYNETLVPTLALVGRMISPDYEPEG